MSDAPFSLTTQFIFPVNLPLIMSTSSTVPEATSESSVSILKNTRPANLLSRQPLKPARSWRNCIAFDHSRILLRQFVFSKGSSALAQIYRLSLDEGEPRATVSAFSRFVARIIYAFVALRQINIFFLHYGSYVKSTHGISALQQLRDSWYCAWRQNQSPRHYYWRKLYLLKNRSHWLENLEHRQVTALLDHLNRQLPIAKATDKRQFNQHCIDHDLPAPRAIASWNKSGEFSQKPTGPVAADLFLKPATDYGSVGIMPVPYDQAAGTYRLKSADFTWEQLITAIGGMARDDRRGLILQRRLRNAARNAIYGDDDICNLRIVTAHPPGGEPEALSAFIRLPSSMTTTGHSRNILVASIDIQTGRMHQGLFREPILGEFPVHPDTKAPIENRILSGWSEMLGLALQGHRTLPWLPFIGWDVVDTTDGVMLLEANAYWGADSLQLPGATPLGRTRFPEIYLQCFEHFYGPNRPAHRFPSK